jgi:alpha-galactosidase
MRECKFNIKYSINGQEFVDNRYITEHYVAEATFLDESVKIILKPTADALNLISASLEYNADLNNDDKFFVNGYQAWSTSREYGKSDKQQGVSKVFKVFPMFRYLGETSGEYQFKPYTEKEGVFHGYTYAYVRKGNNFTLYGSLNERSGFTVFNCDFNKNLLTIEKDVEGAVANGSYELFNLVKIEGSYDEVFKKYFKNWNIPKRKIDFLSGYTSWYNYFQKIDENIILRDLNGLDRAKNETSIFQIDDGYAPFVGDWLDYCEDFPRGMKVVREEIHKKNYLAGIWLAPFSVQKASKTAKQNPHWLIKKPNGKPMLGCVAWGGAYTLDIEIPEVRAHIKNFFNVVLNDWGFDMVKLDFLYSICMMPRNGKSRGQLMVEGMEFLRECVGDKLLLGCGVPLGATFGYADACRISCDADLSFKPRIWNTVHINNEVPSVQNAMINAIFRRHLSQNAFLNDPDVFFLRDFNLKFNKQQKLLLAKINNLFGDVLFVSDDVGKYGDEEVETLKKSFKKSTVQILNAQFIDKDTIEINYKEDLENKNLTFNLITGESNL